MFICAPCLFSSGDQFVWLNHLFTNQHRHELDKFQSFDDEYRMLPTTISVSEDKTKVILRCRTAKHDDLRGTLSLQWPL